MNLLLIESMFFDLYAGAVVQSGREILLQVYLSYGCFIFFIMEDFVKQLLGPLLLNKICNSLTYFFQKMRSYRRI